MADPVMLETVQQEVIASLNDTPYACSSLFPLTGGYGNFVFRGRLKEKLPNGVAEVAIKHGKGHVASDANMLIPMSRCVWP